MNRTDKYQEDREQIRKASERDVLEYIETRKNDKAFIEKVLMVIDCEILKAEDL